MDCKGRIRELHPCFGARTNKGRIHLPVCLGCNIECAFCNRRINDTENQPGVTSAVLTPEEAVDVLGRALEQCPQIMVAGIAGPGDALLTDNAISTFRLVGERYPTLLKCLSTNGLLLNERADELIEIGLDTLTVTLNAVDPKILAQIVTGVTYHGKRYEGEAGAEILIRNQLGGIRKMAAVNITIKVNTVLIPEINANHIIEITKTVRRAGATVYNIIPLIPQHKLAQLSEPTCAQIEAARKEAEQYIDVFRHCQRCRADAAGIPGQLEFGSTLYQKKGVFENTFSHG